MKKQLPQYLALIILTAILATALLVPTTGLAAAELPSDVVYRYTSPEGINFDSYTPVWDTDKLRALYEQLMGNLLGEELAYLGTVKLLPGKGPGGVRGNIELRWQTSSAGRLRLYKERVINIFEADTKTTPDQAAHTLSHEYGHLFTYYWLIKKENKTPGDPTTSWAKLRQLQDLPVRWRDSNLPYNHFWEAKEILAGEYSQLFGHPVAKEHGPENIVVTPPDSVTGLREYWLNLAGLEQQDKPELLAQPLLIDFTTSYIERESFDFDLLQVINEREPVYSLSFSPASNSSERNARLEYSLHWSLRREPYGSWGCGESVTNRGSADFKYGAYKKDDNHWFYPGMPKGEAFFRVHVFDPETKQKTFSPMYWFDFTDPLNPVPISDQFLYDDGMVRVYIDTEKLTLEQPPIIMGASTMVPLRGIFERLGAKVAWNGTEQSLIVRSGSRIVELNINSKIATIDGRTVELAQSPALVNSKTLVPLRFVSEALGAKVHWDAKCHSVEITSP